MPKFSTLEEEIGQVVNETIGLSPSVGWPKSVAHRQCIIMPNSDSLWLDFDNGTFCQPSNSLVLILTHQGTDLSLAFKTFKEWVLELATTFPKSILGSGGQCPTILGVNSPGRLDKASNLVAIEVFMQPIETTME